MQALYRDCTGSHIWIAAEASSDHLMCSLQTAVVMITPPRIHNNHPKLTKHQLLYLSAYWPSDPMSLHCRGLPCALDNVHKHPCPRDAPVLTR